MPTTHADLIQRVSDGELTPEQAEVEASRLGLSPLTNLPDPARFDPMAEAFWSLTMVIAWIMSRDAADVREAWDAYRMACIEWRYVEVRVSPDGEVQGHASIGPRDPSNLDRMELAARFSALQDGALGTGQPVEDARVDLWRRLQLGDVTCHGVSSHNGTREEIPAVRWYDLQARVEKHRDYVVADGLGQARLCYWDLCFAKREVLLLWPPKLPMDFNGRSTGASKAATAALASIETEDDRMEMEGATKAARSPPFVKPEGAGFMPLFCAAQWIALEGGARAFESVSAEDWSRAYQDLLAQVASGRVAISGERSGLREAIDGATFADCRVSSLFWPDDPGLEHSENFYVLSYPYLDEQHWRSAFHDSLTNRWETRWARLTVRKEDVARLWPLDPNALGRTGTPGRPTSKALVIAEFERRKAAGLVGPRIAQEARELANWLTRHHPASPTMTPKTVANVIRGLFKAR